MRREEAYWLPAASFRSLSWLGGGGKLTPAQAQCSELSPDPSGVSAVTCRNLHFVSIHTSGCTASQLRDCSLTSQELLLSTVDAPGPSQRPADPAWRQPHSNAHSKFQPLPDRRRGLSQTGATVTKAFCLLFLHRCAPGRLHS